MHSSEHSSPSGLGLADSLAQNTKRWPRSPQSQSASQEEEEIMSSEVESEYDSGDRTPDPSATLRQDNTADLFRKVYEIEQRNKAQALSETSSRVYGSPEVESLEESPRESREPSPVVIGSSVGSPEMNSVADSPVNHRSTSVPVVHVNGSDSPGIHVNGLNSPENLDTARSHNSPLSESYESSPVDEANPIIEETPHELGDPKVLSIWALKDGIWRPAFPLDQKSSGQQMVKFPGQENATSVFNYETRPLVLDVDLMVRTDDFPGEFKVVDLIKDPEALYCTLDRYSRVELANGSKPEMVGIDKLYIQDDEQRVRKRHKPLAIFATCLFAITQTEHDAQLQRTIRDHGGTVVGSMEELFVVEEDSETLVWAGETDYRFGAVVSSKQSQTPKFLQGLAMGLPCLSHQYIADSIAAGTLLDPKEFTIASPLHRDYTHLTLDQQFYLRTIVLAPIVPPICLLGDSDSPFYTLVVLACGKPVQTISTLEEAPPGSLVVQDSSQGLGELPRVIRDQLPRKVRLLETICMSQDWVIQCVTSGTLV